MILILVMINIASYKKRLVVVSLTNIVQNYVVCILDLLAHGYMVYKS